MNRITLAIAAAMVLNGCGSPVQFSDDIDFNLNFLTALAADNDALNSPYVRGATVRFHASSAVNLQQYRLESLDPDVLQLSDGQDVEEEYIATYATALGVGTAEVVVVDGDGSVLDSVFVDVAVPTRFELHAAGPLFTHLAEDATLTATPAVLAGGTATFQVRYFDGDERLAGHDVLGIEANEGIDAQADTTWLFEDREWLRVSPADVGTHPISLSADGAEIGTVNINAVSQDDIASMSLIAESEAGASEDEWLVVLAQAWSAGDQPIYGVEYDWTRNGFTEDGLGDLYRYTYDRTEQADLTANTGGMSDEIVIHGEGFVDSSNRIGCTTTGTTAGWLGLVVLPLLMLRRRSAV